MASVKKPRGIRHDRHCHRCRTKGIKCDLNRPRCQPCQQSQQACHYPQRVVWMGERKSLPQKRSAPSSDTIQADPQYSPAQKDMSVNLYGFIDLLSDFYKEIQSCQQDLPDEAIKLISRTLDFAHSRLQGNNNNKGAIQSHLVAIANLSKVIESAHPIALFGIATFAMFDVCCGSFGGWHCHLYGARSLLDLHCDNKVDLDSLVEQIPGLADVLSYLVWFDVTGALIHERALIFEDWHREILCPSFFDSVGCPPDAFQLYSQLARPKIERSALELSSLAMDQALRFDVADSTDRSLAAVVYRCAGAIVAFSRAGHRHCQNPASTIYSNVLSSMVDRVCNATSRMPITSRFYVHMATPVYLAGMHATTTSQCDTLRGYWRNCQQCDFPRYPDAQEQCERRWRSRLVCGV